MDKFIGKRLDGRYEIQEIIGVGGMAYVYKAHDIVDDRVVAVKILKEEFLENDEFTRRFRNESKAIAILSHPNIVKVLDVSFGDRIQYIVMEYINGVTLKEYIEHNRVGWKEALHFTVQILRALQHAHDKGIVHRDIKPQNIMLLSDGTIKVTDFGIARFSRNQVRTGLNDKAIGSVHYISPEQARGAMTDEKTDIYSVGVMLYEMLTGRLPFEADNAVSVAIMQMQSQAKGVREMNPDVPEGLEEITVRAMQKDPAKRYQSAAEMLYDIDEFKKNPSIHFEYKYLRDDVPTKFVETITTIKGDKPDEGEETPEEKKRTGPPVLPILAAVTGVVVLAVLIVVAIIMFKEIAPSSEGDIIVPNVVERVYSELQASELGDFAGKVQLNYENSKEPEGTIIAQVPAGNSTVKAAKSLTLTISLGPKMVEVPEVTAIDTEEKYTTTLKSRQFAYTVVDVSDEKVPAGFVVTPEPADPEQAAEGSTIRVFVSTGAEPVEDVLVPNVVGTAQKDAIEQLKDKGFVVDEGDIVTKNHDSFAQGLVISQSPAGDTMLQPGKEVKLVVSSGYRNVSLEVDLPNVSHAINLSVYIDGYPGAGFDDLKGLLPTDIRSVTLNFTEQKESYTVTVRIKPRDGSGEEMDYVKYSVNGRTGAATLIAQYPYTGTPSTQPTTAEPSDVTPD